MTQARLAILAPSPGLVRRMALGYARANIDRFLEHVREHGSGSETWEHVAPEGEMSAEVIALQSEKEIAQAEKGLMLNSLIATEQSSDALRALPVYCSRAVIAWALRFVVDDLTAGRPVPVTVHDCPSRFRPWNAREIALIATAEIAHLQSAPDAPLRW